MPKGYIIVHVTVRDAERYSEYIRLDTPILERHGARFLVRGGQAQTMEGQHYDRHVVIEFDSYDDALTAWNDPEYQKVAEIRRASAEASFFVVEGTAMS